MVHFMRMLPTATDFFWLSVVEEWLLLLESLIRHYKKMLPCVHINGAIASPDGQQ